MGITFYPYFELTITVVISGDVDITHGSEHGCNTSTSLRAGFSISYVVEEIQNSNSFTTKNGQGFEYMYHSDFGDW